MTDTWDDWAEGWDQNPLVQLYAEKAFASLLELVNPQGLQVLDFGCGTGSLTQRLAPLVKSLVALDPSPKMLAGLQAKNLPQVTPLCGQLQDLAALGAPRFDLVVASSALAFVPDFAASLKQIKGLLNPGGQVVQWDWLVEVGSSEPGFHPQELHKAYALAGLRLVQTSTPFVLSGPEGDMPVLMALARL